MSEKKAAPHGWLILDKPRGLGSTQAVSADKRVLRQGGHAKTKVGHGGTLAPLAEGVLPIALGEAPKLAGRMLDSDKLYAFPIQFGEQTDTLDTEGDLRPGLSRELQLTSRLRWVNELEYDTHSKWEWNSGLKYRLNKTWSFTGGFHSDHGFGAGLNFQW